MQTFVSSDGLFAIIPSRHTIEADEVPVILFRLSRALGDLAEIVAAVNARDPIAAALSLVELYSNIIEIKKEIED